MPYLSPLALAVLIFNGGLADSNCPPTDVPLHHLLRQVYPLPPPTETRLPPPTETSEPTHDFSTSSYIDAIASN